MIIEDDSEILDVLSTIFQISCPNVRIQSASSGKRGIETIGTMDPDLVLLDLGLPDVNGFQVLKEIRGFSDVPVIILSARGDEGDVVRGLTLGANDYIIKPFRHMELLARVRRLLTKKQFAEEDLSISCGNFRFGSSIHELWCNNSRVNLTTSEGRLIHSLMKHVNKVVSYEQLSDLLWGEYYPGAQASLKSYVLRIRKKIEMDPKNPQNLLNSPNQGYLLRT
ncbi:MAG: response regulator transcription factor [Dehalogenimonas sp.]